MHKKEKWFKTSDVRGRFEDMDFSIMKTAGFNLVAFSVMMLEDTFYFETKEEAISAYEYFEGGEAATREYVGWWYSIDELESNNKYYIEEMKNDKIPELIKIDTK